jgi:hypothetical protein
MSEPQQPAAPNPSGDRTALTREEKMQLLHDELLRLNAQLEYLRLMLRLRRPQA